MKHDDIRHMLSEYIDGAVTPKEKALVEGHLKSCPECSSALFELKKTIEHVKKIEEVDSPAWMTQKIMAKVREEAEEKRGLFRKLFYPLHIKLPLEAVAMAFLAITAFYIYESVHPEMKFAEAPGEGVIARSEVPRQSQKLKAPGIREKKIARPPVPAESKPAPATGKPAEQTLGDRTFQDKTGRFATASRPAAPALQGRAFEEQETPAPAKKQEAVMPYAGAAAKDEARSETPARALKAKSFASAEKKESGIRLSVIIKDLDAADKEVERVVARLNGRIIKTESFDNRRSVAVKLNSSKWKEFVEKLKHVGQVQEQGLPSFFQEGDIDIRIELLKAPTQK